MKTLTKKLTADEQKALLEKAANQTKNEKLNTYRGVHTVVREAVNPAVFN